MKKIIVTGGTRGLGLAVSKTLAQKGFSVIAAGRQRSAELEAAMQDHDIKYARLNLEDLAQIQPFVNELYDKHGSIYGLVNNAALGLDGILGTMHNSDISRMVKVNVEAPLVLTKYISRKIMMNANGGRIVNISSIIASTGFSGLSVYAATKAAMEGFTKSLARELGRRNITVNSVAPGYMKTGMTSGISDSKLEQIVRRSAMRKLVSVDDAAEMVAFLCSNEAKYVTGTVFTVDAGATA